MFLVHILQLLYRLQPRRYEPTCEPFVLTAEQWLVIHDRTENARRVS